MINAKLCSLVINVVQSLLRATTREIFHRFLYAICDWRVFLLRVTGQHVHALYKRTAKLVPLEEPTSKLSVPRVKIQNRNSA